MIDNILDNFEKNIEQLNPEQSVKTFLEIKRYVLEQIDLVRTVHQQEEQLNTHIDNARVRARNN